MKKVAIISLLILALSFVLAETMLADTKYMVNDRMLTDMTVQELYDLEDELVDALDVVFSKGTSETEDGELIGTYVLNPKTHKFHYPDCYSAIQIGEGRKFMYVAASELVGMGYKPCGMCRPYYETDVAEP